MKTFLFFRGYVESRLLDIDWDAINRLNNPNTIITPRWTPTWQGINYQPTWVVNPGYIQYTLPNYTITTTPGSGTITLPYMYGTTTTTTLTTSNPNGITYTTGGFGGTLTTGTATFRSGAFTTKTM
jgi:hypothetical protein